MIHEWICTNWCMIPPTSDLDGCQSKKKNKKSRGMNFKYISSETTMLIFAEMIISWSLSKIVSGILDIQPNMAVTSKLSYTQDPI